MIPLPPDIHADDQAEDAVILFTACSAVAKVTESTDRLPRNHAVRVAVGGAGKAIYKAAKLFRLIMSDKAIQVAETRLKEVREALDLPPNNESEPRS